MEDGTVLDPFSRTTTTIFGALNVT